MSYKVFAVDPRWKEPSRQKFMRDHLAEELELVVPESFETDALLRDLKSADALVTGLGPITEEMMKAAPNLRVVERETGALLFQIGRNADEQREADRHDAPHVLLGVAADALDHRMETVAAGAAEVLL